MSGLFSDRVKELGLPLDQVVVVSSGIMDELGIRRADDIDLVTTPEVFERLKSVSGWRMTEQLGRPVQLHDKDKVELFMEWAVPPDGRTVTFQDLMKVSRVINEVRFVTLDFLYDWKAWYGREKDSVDRELIDAYWRNA